MREGEEEEEVGAYMHTLFFLKRVAMPEVRALTESSFCFIIAARSSVTSPTAVEEEEVWQWKRRRRR